MTRTAAALAFFAVMACNEVIIQQTNALRLSSASSASKKKRSGQKKRPLRHPFRTSLKSLAWAARNGSSTWGDHIASSGRASSSKRAKQYQSTSMKQSSSIFISKLHKKIQTKQQQHPKDTQKRTKKLYKKHHYASIEKMMEQNSYDYPEEHFLQEILAVVISGAAATSAFAAVTTGAFIATLAVAVGSVTTVLFFDETEDVEVADVTFIDTTDDDADDQEEITEEDCDITGKSDIDAQGSNKILQQHEEPMFQPVKKLTNFTMDELRRCYKGTPPQMTLQFLHPHRHDENMCMVYTESDKSTTSEKYEAEYSASNALVDDVVSALEDACSTGDCEKIVPSLKRVNVVWHDPNIADGYIYTSDKVKPKGKEHGKRSRRISRSGRSDSQHENDYTESLADAEKEGALLLSQSFRVAASAFGIVADAVRFTGETAAVCTGGTARLAGGVFRLSGWAVNSLGSAIEHGGGGKRDSISQEEEPQSGKLRTSRRKVAGESVRLLGESIEQVADSLLLAGSATERVAFAAASVAEGAVRFFGDIALSVSEMFARESQNLLTSGSASSARMHTLDSDVKEEDRNADQSISTSATILALNKTTTNIEGSLIASQINGEYYNESDFFGWAWNNVDGMMADTLGVGSLAPELLGVFVACYLGSLILLRRNDYRSGECKQPPQKPSHISIPREHSHAPNATFTHDTLNDTDSHTTLTADWTTKHVTGHCRFTFLKRITTNFLLLLLLPMKLLFLSVGWVCRLLFNRKLILLVLYSMGFLFLSRSSQYKAAVIRRKSELLGYHDAIASIGKSSISYVESSMWLNTILNNVWRVSDDTPSISFGGLEPYLSSVASASLVESLSGSYNKPSGVAHVSFNSFTLGKTPPMIRGIEVLRIDGDTSVVYMTIDVGILMDAELLLDISPSSLDYKMVPTTVLSINSLDAKLQLDVSVKSIPSYPYISNVNVSLSHEIPDFSLRIEPRSQNGMKGVDFGSFPLISKWIKESIFESLRDYVTPKYISFDVLAWLNGDSRIVSYMT